MDISFFIRGLLIGLSIAATVGPMSVLCIQRTLNKGQLYGLVSGLGIATADGVYGSIAAFGLTLITNFLIHGANLDPLDWRSISHVPGCKDYSLQTTRESSARYENK